MFSHPLMNRRLLVAAACAAVFVGGAARADRSRFWDYYQPYPTNYIGSREWWQGDAALGDWWGSRIWLKKDLGIDFSLTYTNNIAGNVVGGRERGATYTDNVGFGVEFQLEKLVGWKGAVLVVSGLNRSGRSLSQRDIGNQFTVQQVYGSQTAMFYALALTQNLFDDKVQLKLGRMAAGDDFASSPIYWLYMNNGIDGNPQALPVNTGFSTYPSATWGARVRFDPTPEWNALDGIYQPSPQYGNRGYHGLNFRIRHDDGVILLGQVGWTPEFAKKEVPISALPKDDPARKAAEKSAPADGGKGAGKAFAEPTVRKGLPGNYWLGAYDSPTDYGQFGTADRAYNSYGFYAHADQMVYQEAPGSDQGLTLWTALVLSPQQNIAKLPFEANGGLVYKGLIPTRDEDQSMIGVVYGKFSEDYARATRGDGGGYPDYELVFEFGHRVQFNSFLYVQPNIQYVINPGGAHDIPNALVLGAQCGVTF